MKIELFLDEDIHSALAHALRKRGYDAITSMQKANKNTGESLFQNNFHSEKRCQDCCACFSVLPKKQ